MPVPAAIPAFSSNPTVPLHRVRFFDYTPSPITALAFSPTPLPAPTDSAAKGKAKALTNIESNELGVLVVARENGEVEIWEWVAPDDNSMGNWVMEKVCRYYWWKVGTKLTFYRYYLQLSHISECHSWLW